MVRAEVLCWLRLCGLLGFSFSLIPLYWVLAPPFYSTGFWLSLYSFFWGLAPPSSTLLGFDSPFIFSYWVLAPPLAFFHWGLAPPSSILLIFGSPFILIFFWVFTPPSFCFTGFWILPLLFPLGFGSGLPRLFCCVLAPPSPFFFTGFWLLLPAQLGLGFSLIYSLRDLTPSSSVFLGFGSFYFTGFWLRPHFLGFDSTFLFYI